MHERNKDFRVVDVMQIMGVSQAAVLAWIKSGKLAAYNVAVSETARPIYRVTAEAIEDFKKNRTVVKVDAKKPTMRRRLPETIQKFF
jgi:predicted transcriptional regulator